MTLYFDCDGTFIDFYSVPNWLNSIRNEDSTPYRVARPLINLNSFARVLNTKQRKGYRIGIISWTSEQEVNAFHYEVIEAKKKWLYKHLKSVHFDEIHIIPRGTNKYGVVLDKNGVLFDDETKNRTQWKSISYDEKDLIKVLKTL